MALLEKLWDDVLAGPRPEKGLGKLRRKVSNQDGEAKEYKRSMSMPATPMTPETPPATAAKKVNVWRSVFHPGSNINTKTIGADLFDKPQPNSPTVYDWMYSGNSRSEHR